MLICHYGHCDHNVFHCLQSCALLNTQDEEKQKILIPLQVILANASTVYTDVFPVMRSNAQSHHLNLFSLSLSLSLSSHLLLVRHMSQTLQQSQSPAVVNAIHQMITTSVSGCQSSLVKPTFIQGKDTDSHRYRFWRYVGIFQPVPKGEHKRLFFV